MKGEMIIKATEHGFGIAVDLRDVNPIDKVELLHSVATSLQMSHVDIITYCQMERIGAFTEAESVTYCEDEAQMDALLQREGPGTQKTEMTTEEWLEQMRKFMEHMGV